MADKKDSDKNQEESGTLGGRHHSENDSASAKSRTTSGRSAKKIAMTLKKPVLNNEERDGEDEGRSSGPVGLDVGTSHIVAAQNKRNFVHSIQDLNAFFTVPNAKFAKNILS